MTKRQTICVLGGSGFVGGHLVNHLAAAGHKVRVPTRHRERHRDLLVLPGVEVMEADVHDGATLTELFAGCDAVINLVAILNESRRAGFRAVHVELPHRVAQICRSTGVQRLLHMSALNADAKQGASNYLRSKGEGEDLVHATANENFKVTSFRPSVIFGPGDHFFNHFAGLLGMTPVLPLPCPDSRVAPVYVGDVARVFITALNNKATFGQRYELCGPRAYTLRDLMHYTARILGLKRTILGLPGGLSRLQAQLMQLLPGKPFTLDNYHSLQVDAVCSSPFPALFKITPASVESVVPYYLGHDQQARFDAIRIEARHDY